MEVPVPLPQSLIADAVGLTKFHINRTLKRRGDSGLLFLRKRGLSIPEPEPLAEQANCNPVAMSRQARPMI